MDQRQSSFTIIALIAVLASFPSQAFGDDPSLAARVNELFAKWDRPDSPGCVVGVIRRGELVHSRGYGGADLDHGVQLSADSVLEVGSMAKSFTAVCVALLADQGKISLDDDVRRYVPELPEYEDPIRLRHLIQCTSGLSDYYMTWQLIGRDWEDVCTVEDVLRLICLQQKLPFTPGARFAYSNSDYFLLGLIVNRATGLSLRQFADEQVFRPLGMSRTHFADDRTRVVPGRAVGYHPRIGGGFRRCLPNSNVVGPVGLKTTVNDLFLWDQNFYQNRLPDGPLLREFLSQGTLLGSRNTFDTDPRAEYRGLRRIEFTGGVPGFMSCLVRFPEQRFSVIVLSNYTNIASWVFAWDIADLYLAQEMAPRSVDGEKLWDDNPRFVELSHEALHERAGGYRDATGHYVRLAVTDGRLTFLNPYGWEFPLSPLGRTRFRSLETLGQFDLDFRSREPAGPPAVHVERKRGGDEWWEAVALAKPTPEELAEYAGVFHCADLETRYRILVADGRLSLQINNRGAHELTPAIKDVFIPRGQIEDAILTFTRDAEQQINRINVDLWSVKSVRFERLRSR